MTEVTVLILLLVIFFLLGNLMLICLKRDMKKVTDSAETCLKASKAVQFQSLTDAANWIEKEPTFTGKELADYLRKFIAARQ